MSRPVVVVQTDCREAAPEILCQEIGWGDYIVAGPIDITETGFVILDGSSGESLMEPGHAFEARLDHPLTSLVDESYSPPARAGASPSEKSPASPNCGGTTVRPVASM
jgi:hypothetical protein